MAGTLFGLSLSQRVDLNGIPAVGWLLYLFQANTSTPVNSYQDVALTVLNPWPIAADAYGMMRQFWLADGSYRARATSQDGSITYFDQLSILALGPSSGAAPSGGVDPTTTFQTGDVMWLDRQGVRAGWVRDNGLTIGNAVSGGSERANEDCRALYTFLWNNFADNICPVAGGRGSNPNSDFDAPKLLGMPDKRDCSIKGLDGMGNVPGTHLDPTIVPILTPGATFDTPGCLIGNNHMQLGVQHLPSHGHTASTSVTDPGHFHSQLASPSTGSYSTGGSNGPLGNGSNTGTAVTGISVGVTIGNTGSDVAHSNVERSIMGTFYRKL